MLLRYYIEIARLNRPIGAILLFWPCFWGWILAQETLLIDTSFTFLFYLLIGSFLLRGSGCIINDIIDRSIDKKILRTKNRPLAANLISLEQALLALLIFLSLGFWIFLKLPKIAQSWSLLGAILMVVYPYCKRYFHYPQLILGLAFNIGIFVAYTCFHTTLNPKIIFFFFAGVSWTIAYDTIYAFQDLNDDLKHHVFSTAVKWKEHPKKFVAFIYFIGFICLSLSGSKYLSLLVYIIATSGILTLWKPRCIESCSRCFNAHAWLSFILILR